MGDVTYESVGAESVADVAQDYDFDGAPAGPGYEETGAEPWTGPSREEWEALRAGQEQAQALYAPLMQWAQGHHEARAQVEAEEADAYWQSRLDPFSDEHDPDAYIELAQAIAEQETAPLREYVAGLQEAELESNASDMAYEILEAQGVVEEHMDAVYDRGDEILEEITRVNGVGSMHELQTLVAEHYGVSVGQAGLWLGEGALQMAAEEHHRRSAPRPESIAQFARERMSGLPPRDASGRFVSANPPRPDSLVDVARRWR